MIFELKFLIFLQLKLFKQLNYLDQQTKLYPKH